MAKCETCGQELPTPVLLQHNYMNIYVDDATDKVDGSYNCKDEYITVKGKKLRRQDVVKAKAVVEVKK